MLTLASSQLCCRSNKCISITLLSFSLASIATLNVMILRSQYIIYHVLLYSGHQLKDVIASCCFVDMLLQKAVPYVRHPGTRRQCSATRCPNGLSSGWCITFSLVFAILENLALLGLLTQAYYLCGLAFFHH